MMQTQFSLNRVGIAVSKHQNYQKIDLLYLGDKIEFDVLNEGTLSGITL